MATRTSKGGRPAAARVVPTTRLTVKVPTTLLRLASRVYQIARGEPFDFQRWAMRGIILDISTDMGQSPARDKPDSGWIDNDIAHRLDFFNKATGDYEPFLNAVARGIPRAVVEAERMTTARLRPQISDEELRAKYPEVSQRRGRA